MGRLPPLASQTDWAPLPDSSANALLCVCGEGDCQACLEGPRLLLSVSGFLRPPGNKPQAASHRTASKWTELLGGCYCILRHLCIGLHFWPPSSCPPPLLTSLSFVLRQKLKRAVSTENVALALLGAAAECVNRMSISLGRKGETLRPAGGEERPASDPQTDKAT